MTKEIRKLVGKSKSAYVLNIPVKFIKKFGWNAGTYLEIAEDKNGLKIKKTGDDANNNKVAYNEEKKEDRLV